MRIAYEVSGLTCQLGGRDIVCDVDLDVRHGEVLALVGPNGAGKSTLLGALTGDVPIHRGEITLAGRSLQQWSSAELARTRSVLLQANQVSFPFSVQQVVEMGRSPWVGRSSAEQDAAAIGHAIEVTDIGHLLRRSFTALSGGEKARVSLARVLAQDTEVVLLDEPTAALDLRHQEEVMVVAQGLAAAGRAVVVVLHDLSLAAARADRIAMVDRGRIVSIGMPEQVLTPGRVESVYGIGVHVLSDTPDGHLVVVPHRDLPDAMSS